MQLAGAGEVVVLGGPHLVLAHVGGDDGVPVGDSLVMVSRISWGWQHIVLLEGDGSFWPRTPTPSTRGSRGLGQLLVQQLQHPAGVADDVVVGTGRSCRSRPGRCRCGRSWRCLAKVAGSVATRSEKRQPMAMSRSHWSAGDSWRQWEPCIPIMPVNRGWLPGQAPPPMMVEATGAVQRLV